MENAKKEKAQKSEEKAKKCYQDTFLFLKNECLCICAIIKYICKGINCFFKWIYKKLNSINYLFNLSKRLGYLAVVVAIFFFFAERDNRRKAKHYQAWQAINSAQGKTGSGGRIDALQDLNEDGVSFRYIDLSIAELREIDLKSAKLIYANLSWTQLILAHLERSDFSGTFFYCTKLSEAHLDGADFKGTTIIASDFPDATLIGADFKNATIIASDLSNANLTDIIDWKEIKDMKNTNIYGVKNAPDGFKEFAKNDMGAVEIKKRDEWEKKRDDTLRGMVVDHRLKTFKYR